MASVALSTKAIGATVKLKENGTLVDYIVVHKGKPSSIYDASCDGVWLLRKEIFETRAWHSSNVNDWANSTLKSYLDSTFFARFDKDIQAQIKHSRKILQDRPLAPLLIVVLVPLPGRYGILTCLIWA